MRARKTPVADWYMGAEESAVLSADRVIVLSALATEILRVLDEDEWTGVDAVSTALVAVFGEPAHGTAEALADAALAELADLRLVELR